MLYVEENRLQEAEEAFRRSAEINPDFTDALFKLGAVCFQEGRLEEALKAWENTIKINPHRVDALARLAISYYNLQDFSKARSYFAELKKRRVPIDAAILERLGLTK